MSVARNISNAIPPLVDKRPDQETSVEMFWRKASPFFVVNAAILIVSMVGNWVTYHEIFLKIVNEYRNVLRFFWSHLFSFFELNFGIRIDVRFSELFSFLVFAVPIAFPFLGKLGLSGYYKPRFLGAVNPYPLLYSFALWMFAGFFFFSQFFDYHNHFWISLARHFIFEITFLFTIPLFAFAFLPSNTPWIGPFLNTYATIRYRIGAALIAVLLVISIRASGAIPTFKQSDGNQISSTTSLLTAQRPNFDEIDFLKSSLQCDFSLQVPSLDSFKMESTLEKWREMAAAQNHTAKELLNAQYADEVAPLFANLWSDVEPSIPFVAASLVAEEFTSQEYFSYPFLASVVGIEEPDFYSQYISYRTNDLQSNSVDIDAYRNQIQMYFDIEDIKIWLEKTLSSKNSSTSEINPFAEYFLSDIPKVMFEISAEQATNIAIFASNELRCEEYDFQYACSPAPSNETGRQINAALLKATGITQEHLERFNPLPEFFDYVNVNEELQQYFPEGDLGYPYQVLETWHYYYLGDYYLEAGISTSFEEEGPNLRFNYFSWKDRYRYYLNKLNEEAATFSSPSFLNFYNSKKDEAKTNSENAANILEEFFANYKTDTDELAALEKEIGSLPFKLAEKAGEINGDWNTVCENINQAKTEERLALNSIPITDWEQVEGVSRRARSFSKGTVAKTNSIEEKVSVFLPNRVDLLKAKLHQFDKPTGAIQYVCTNSIKISSRGRRKDHSSQFHLSE